MGGWVDRRKGQKGNWRRKGIWEVEVRAYSEYSELVWVLGESYFGKVERG